MKFSKVLILSLSVLLFSQVNCQDFLQNSEESVSSGDASIKVDMKGAWYKQFDLEVSGKDLGYQVGDKITITHPSHLYPSASWGSIAFGNCQVTEGSHLATAVCTISALEEVHKLLSFGLNARDSEGSKAKGVLTVHQKYIETGSIKISAAVSGSTAQTSPHFRLHNSFEVVNEGDLAWDQPTLIEKVSSSKEGVKYSLDTPSFTESGNIFSEQQGESREVKISTGVTTQVSLTYVSRPIPSQTVTLYTHDLPTGSSTTITLTDGTEKESVVVTENSAGSGVEVTILQNQKQWKVTATCEKGYTAKIQPQTFIAKSDSLDVSITIKKFTGVTQFAAYWAGWTGKSHDLARDYAPLGLSTLYLAFANYRSGKIETSVSGSFAEIPKPGSWIEPSYVNWVTFAHQSPDTKCIMSLGGATFSGVWTNLNPTNVGELVAAIKETLSKNFPVYKGSFANAEDLIGYVEIDGIDLDVEMGGNRLDPELGKVLQILVKQLKKALPSNKLVTMASFSVAADPQDKCTVEESVHCGEAIALLKEIVDDIDYVNVMAYDAGQEYATMRYTEAMNNYAQLIGKKAVLGLDNQRQWPGFIETDDQLVSKAKWAYQSDQAIGTFLWEIGGDGDPHGLMSKIKPYVRN